MSKFVGTVIAILGIILLGSGLLVSRTLVSSLLQTLSGLALTLLGFTMTVYTGRSSGRFLAGLIALLGVLLLITSMGQIVTGFPLYSRFGSIIRIGLGILFCVASYVIYEFGQDLYSYEDDIY